MEFFMQHLALSHIVVWSCEIYFNVTSTGANLPPCFQEKAILLILPTTKDREWRGGPILSDCSAMDQGSQGRNLKWKYLVFGRVEGESIGPILLSGGTGLGDIDL